MLATRPAVAVPTLRSEASSLHSSRLAARRTLNFDAMVTAFHRDVMFAGIVLPYFDLFDTGAVEGFRASWWVSQLLLIYVAQMFYPSSIARVTGVTVANMHHGHYPKGLSHKKLTHWFLTNSFLDRSFVRQRWRGLIRGPRTAPQAQETYRLNASLRAVINESAPYWTRLREVSLGKVAASVL
eukprot:NODE_2522_length_1179_cov_22.160177_g2304_i0.p1 GENE.NODE_2522_length_1179_cov_22.160177_g2304_i0~~NODE_2522_length_1179_cov_22.160177_g2304_i0.p1  ORF type:complete len:183 (+),score=27.37 NODE_2522_length_1179_cov_22.160177_g2304_i0:568-1116(+)